MAKFTTGKIEDVLIRPLKKFVDERGWLSELWIWLSNRRWSAWA